MKVHTDNLHTIIPESLKDLYAPIREPILEVETLLTEKLRSDITFVDKLAKYGFRIGGKRLRPALVLLSARTVGHIVPDHVTYGAVLELIHTATLIHDDVLDEADIRRHLDTANARWGNEVSILLGDYLLAMAMEMTSTADSSRAMPVLTRTVRKMCEGELWQVASRGNLDLGEKEYFQIIGGKTAGLLACCCRLGVELGRPEPAKSSQAESQQGTGTKHELGADESDELEAQAQTLHDYGYQLGLAFQIADDLLDLTGNEAETGKSLGTDLAKQKLTLPLIHFMQNAQPADRQRAVSLIGGTDSEDGETSHAWSELPTMLDRFGSIDYARSKARELAKSARLHLDSLPDTDAKRSLVGLTEYIVKRRR